MRVFSQTNNGQQKNKTKTNKQNKKGGPPLLGLAKYIYYAYKVYQNQQYLSCRTIAKYMEKFLQYKNKK